MIRRHPRVIAGTIGYLVLVLLCFTLPGLGPVFVGVAASGSAAAVVVDQRAHHHDR